MAHVGCSSYGAIRTPSAPLGCSPYGAIGTSSAPHDCAADGALASLIDAGFCAPAAQAALAKCDGNVDAAIEWLLCPEGQAVQAAGADVGCGACVATGCASTSSSASSASSASNAAASGAGVAHAAPAEVDECVICTEDMGHADAAMRCSGSGGKRHYFHAHCMSAWVRECERAGKGLTCPVCRGPVQLRARRLQEFLRDKGGKLNAEERSAMHAMHDAATAAADDGWSELKKDLFRAGTFMAIAGGIALLAAAGLQALQQAQEDEDDKH